MDLRIYTDAVFPCTVLYTVQGKIDKCKILPQKKQNTKAPIKSTYDARDMILLGPLALFERWLV
jgi:hypothetical protein